MAKARLRLKDMTLDDKEMKCAALEEAYTEEVATFTAGATRKVVVAAKRTALHDKRTEIANAEAALRTLYEQQDGLEAEVDDQLRAEVTYVEGVANGSAEIILMSGLEVADAPAAKPVPGKVENLAATPGDDEGELDIVFKPQREVADDYEIETAAAADGPWEKAEVIRKSKDTLPGLPSGAKRFVRVRARNNSGKGPWSDIACARAA